MPSSSTSSFTPTPSLVSVNTTASSSSTTPLRPTSSSSSSSPSSQPMQKDYSNSFSLLQSQYGWGPMTSIPTLVPSKKQDTEMREKRRKDRNTRSRSVQEEQEADRRPTGKNYESVFGSLSSRYGFGGHWPTPSKKSKEHRS
ncbi:hypothetical protein LXA43DRAFT_1019962 [Ganoderma leucocontextum]|nr:hypothetical protein LXA43DRAFT_1019962 [Ganoderma leucocontextum]